MYPGRNNEIIRTSFRKQVSYECDIESSMFKSNADLSPLSVEESFHKETQNSKMPSVLNTDLVYIDHSQFSSQFPSMDVPDIPEIHLFRASTVSQE